MKAARKRWKSIALNSGFAPIVLSGLDVGRGDHAHVAQRRICWRWPTIDMNCCWWI
ncbi:MAG: hypothetical protein R2911_09560 [Caldilineaceae bacterium]